MDYLLFDIGGIDEEELLNALNTIPESLEETYQEALEKIPAKQQQRVWNILIWLTCSLRPMTIEEIAAVASIKFPSEVLVVCTSLLVTIIDEKTDKTIKLAHFSVKEYLILKSEESKGLSQYRFQSEQAQAFISKTAVEYFLHSGNSNISNRKGLPASLLKYYAEFWPRHAIKAFDSDYHDTKELQDKINSLFSPDHSQGYITWLQTFDHDRERYDQYIRAGYPEPLYYAALLGLRMTAEKLLVQGCRIRMYEGRKGNALNAAAIEGNFEIIKYSEKHHERVWRMADLAKIAREIRKNVENTFVLFLTKEAELVITEKVVKAAAENEECGKEVMMLLLEKRGADVVITEEVVKAAAGNRLNGKKVMLLLLEKRGADVVITEEVVKAAAGNRLNGKEVMILLLEKRGADVVITEEVVKTIAGRFGKGVMMLLLEKRGADVVITEEVVKAAAGNWHNGKEVMMLLLEKRGADVVITEEVVKAAAGNEENGKEVMMLLLEKRGVEVVITEEVVKAAAVNGQEQVLHIFETDLATKVSSWVPVARLYNASKAGNKNMVQTLLAQGVYPNSKDEQGRTPLWWSASNGHLSITTLLLGKDDIPLNEADREGCTPLHEAAGNGHLSIVKILLCQDGINPELIDINGKTAFAWAIENGYAGIADILKTFVKSKE
ncbi:hypothetical protein HYALB_00000960 [Hymenoscyphus albidus]|uniref:GPI inositol-deacylase winged helix domain-containing protein n=1 Tax=Hymenoscyphus albidus TaxID=595503 RepID=A0A9N9QCR1_9HELO|nr:hypothetical protein HYALB_00000960 [Hymenoscyphus albidus]